MEQYRIVAAAGKPPIPIPTDEKLTPEIIRNWAQQCRDAYEKTRGGFLLSKAFFLWFMQAGFAVEFARWAAGCILDS